MVFLIRASRISYGIIMIALCIQQLFYGEFRPVILPPWPSFLPGHAFFLYFSSTLFIIACLAIIADIKTRRVSLILGGIFLLLVIFVQIPYELFVDPYNGHLGSWGFAM